MNVTQKVIWITGASSGIGAALAIELSKRECKLILSARKQDKLMETKEACSGNPDDIAILPVDVGITDELTQKTEAAEQIFGPIDILVNNAGISQRSLCVDTQLEVYARLMNINYLGTVGLTKALLPQMIARGSGQIVVVSSLTGKFGTPLRTGYSASKHALHGFFDSLRTEVHQHGIEVLLICPGFIRTNISINAVVGDGSNQGKMDEAQAKGMDPYHCARKMISAMEAGKEEVNIGGNETFGVLIKRFFPTLFSRIIRSTKVT